MANPYTIIKTEIAATTTLTALIGSRYFALAIPYGTPLPVVLYRMTSDVPMEGFTDSATHIMPTMAVDCIGATPESMDAVAVQVHAALTDTTGGSTKGFDRIRYQNARDEAIEMGTTDATMVAYSRTLDYIVDLRA